MSLSTHIQTVRKLKPFLDAAASLIEMAERLQSLDQQVIDGEARVTRARQDADSAKAYADSARAFSVEHIAKAKAEAVKIEAAAGAILADAKDRAEAAAMAEKNAGLEIARRAADKVAKLEAEAQVLSEAVAARASECAALDSKITAARETIRKQLEA